jgi:hypothetical protein
MGMKDIGIDRHDVRLPGMQHWFSADLARMVGLPGFTAMPWKIVAGLQDVHDQIRSPTELPPKMTSGSACRGGRASLAGGREACQYVEPKADATPVGERLTTA